MNGKFFEVLLAAAVVLTATDWAFKGLQDIGPSYLYYNPNELLSDEATSSRSVRTNAPENQDASFFNKEEQNILNTIINLEESQMSSRTVAESQNYFAYPLFSQNSEETRSGSHNVHQDSGLQELPFDIQGGVSPGAARPSSSWPPSPSSPIDDGELFGAVGYAPLSDNQYFDIESFLNADFPSELATESAIGSLFSSPSLGRSTSVTSEQTEAIDQIAELLSASIDSPSSPEFSSKRGPSFPKQFTSVKGAVDEEGPTHSFLKTPMVHGTSTIDEYERLLQNDEEVPDVKSRRKANAIREIQSYDHVQKPSVVLKRKLKNEPVSPSSESDCSTQNQLSPSSDYEYTDNVSSGSSGLDLLQANEGKKQFPGDQKQKIWLDLPYTKHDMINSKIEDFNEILTQLEPLRQHVAKEIRRKGKNKLAARNCRKRKIDAIDKLDVGVGELEKERQFLLDERLQLELEREEIIRKTEFLYEHIFKNLRDERGLPYSQDNYALTYTADGAVYLVRTKSKDVESIKSR